MARMFKLVIGERRLIRDEFRQALIYTHELRTHTVCQTGKGARSSRYRAENGFAIGSSNQGGLACTQKEINEESAGIAPQYAWIIRCDVNRGIQAVLIGRGIAVAQLQNRGPHRGRAEIDQHFTHDSDVPVAPFFTDGGASLLKTLKQLGLVARILPLCHLLPGDKRGSICDPFGESRQGFIVGCHRPRQIVEQVFGQFTVRASLSS